MGASSLTGLPSWPSVVVLHGTHRVCLATVKGVSGSSVETAQRCVFVLPFHSLRLNIALYLNSRSSTQLESATRFWNVFDNFVSAKRRKQLSLNLEASPVVSGEPESGLPSVFVTLSVFLWSPPCCHPLCTDLPHTRASSRCVCFYPCVLHGSTQVHYFRCWENKIKVYIQWRTLESRAKEMSKKKNLSLEKTSFYVLVHFLLAFFSVH